MINAYLHLSRQSASGVSFSQQEWQPTIEANPGYACAITLIIAQLVPGSQRVNGG